MIVVVELSGTEGWEVIVPVRREGQHSGRPEGLAGCSGHGGFAG